MGFPPQPTPPHTHTKAALSPSGTLHSGGAAARSPTYTPRGTEAHNRPKGDRARGSRVEPSRAAAGTRRAPWEGGTQSLPHFLLPPSPAGGAVGIRGCRGGEAGRGKGVRGAGEELVLEPEFLNGLTWPPVENPCGVGRLRSCAWWTHKTKRPSWRMKILSLAKPGAAPQQGPATAEPKATLPGRSHPSVPLIPRLLGSEARSWEPPDSALGARHPQPAVRLKPGQAF